MKDNIRVAYLLALRNILKNKKTLFIIALVLAMSFISLTFFTSVIAGLTEKFESQFITGPIGNILIEPQEENKYINNYKNLQGTINHLPNTDSSTARIKTSVTIETDSKSMGKTITAIVPSNEIRVSSMGNNLFSGQFLSDGDDNEIVLGSKLVLSAANPSGSTASMLDVQVGDKILLKFNNGHEEEFRVKGIYKTGANFNDGEIYITRKKFDSIYPELKDSASEISIKLPKKGIEAEYTQTLLEQGVSETISDWTKKTDQIEQFTGSLDLVNKITSLIGLLTAIATIYIVVFIDILHKKKQIGILKAIGIKEESVILSSIFQAFIYGIVGVILGIIAIYSMQWYFSVYPLKMSIGKVTLAIDYIFIIKSALLLLLASIIAGFFPAFKASRENILRLIFRE